MKKLLLLFFSLLISLNSFGDNWKQIIMPDDDNISFWINTDSMKKHNDFVYWWDYIDFPQGTNVQYETTKYIDGAKGYESYKQGDCGVIRYKELAGYYYGGRFFSGPRWENKLFSNEWTFPPSDTPSEFILDYVCDYVD